MIIEKGADAMKRRFSLKTGLLSIIVICWLVHITLIDGQTLMTRVAPPFDTELIKPGSAVRLVIDGSIRVVE